MLDSLARSIAQRRVVLFAGAGVSAGLGLPTWRNLTSKIAEELEYDPDLLLGSGESYLTIAEYYKLEKGKIGELRSWMDREWNVTDEKLLNSEVYNKVVDLNFPFIYTTNYDRNFERIHKLRGVRYSKIANAKDIALTDADATQIVKFHGDFDDDQSIVLTESDYFERLSFETPLDVKLRADILGRSVLFVGYSLSDINMRLLLYKMQKMWKQSGYEGDRPLSYMFMARPDPVQQRVLKSWGVETLTQDVDSIDDALPKLFDDLGSAVSALS